MAKYKIPPKLRGFDTARVTHQQVVKCPRCSNAIRHLDWVATNELCPSCRAPIRITFTVELLRR